MFLDIKVHIRSVIITYTLESLSSLIGGHQVTSLNASPPGQNGRHFADDIFKCIFLNENARISLNISLKFIPKVRINNIPAFVQIMAWRQPGDKSLSEPMMVSLLTHICVTRPQWVNSSPWDKMDAILQMTFSNVFYWMKIYELQLQFHWSLFLEVELTICQHWIR